MMGASPGFVMACRAAGLGPVASSTCAIRVVGSAGVTARRRRATPGSPTSSARTCSSTSAAAAPTSAAAWCRTTRCCRSGPAMISGPCPRRRRARLRRGRPRGGRRARRAGRDRTDAVDAGRAVGRRRRHAGCGRRTSTTTPGIWRHGDWIVFEPDGSCVVTGRSRRDPEPRRRPAGHRRVLPRGRGARRGRRQSRGPPRGPGRRQRRAAALRRARARAATTSVALRSPSGQPPRRAVAPARARPRSSRCRPCRATSPARSWSCRSSGSCRACRPAEVASRDALADPASLDAVRRPWPRAGARIGAAS